MMNTKTLRIEYVRGNLIGTDERFVVLRARFNLYGGHYVLVFDNRRAELVTYFVDVNGELFSGRYFNCIDTAIEDLESR